MNATEFPKPVPANTARTYAQRWAEFAAWCARTGHSPCPATSDTLEAYTSTLCEANYAPSSIDVAIAAIRARHIDAGQLVPDATAARRITAAHRRGRAPRNARILTLDEVHSMLATCDTDSPRGLRDAVIVALGTALMSNVSALCGLDLADITPFPRGLNIVVRGRARATHVATVPHGSGQDTDPVRLTRRWIDVLAQHDILGGPLLRSCGRGGRLETSGRLSPGALNLILRRLAQHAGIADCQEICTHSLRATGATLAASAGVPTATIAEHGAWAPSSDAVSQYVHAANQWSHIAMHDFGI
ncbi:MAG TPA: tyrosine-type recombinase/integrase [Actinocrinis sp.]|jgi:integrase|uniref:tyrosine-type recombinase/integrase n=1 Tax=Actinocrinis sp. TaxID=1920516 RepID=UPI002DDDA2CE|nr:tyrosine-type recombinase/integrase [Actinocrinis sp.]HEV3168960.1 tyrosine-type recombinase/integrase [Actinocrinis sp.]